jgi:hypothetical protein
MKNKYFTPDIKDIRVGFVAEWLQEIDTPSEYWELRTLQHYNLTTAARSLALIKKPTVRVPYLTKEQIEAEGWKYDLDQTDGAITFVKKVKGRYYELHFNSKKKEVLINHSSDSLPFKCNDINTFRTIIKLLGI